ncbi:MAG: hypothetical protein LBN40_02295 [Oscillospiraceae bacterium]|jgi:hypothetical protein|nr:hypothetical protein [Oscillospiraceae bacterium]
MNAIHVASAAPYFAAYPDTDYRSSDADTLVAALSALMWRRLGGSIAFVCDKASARDADRTGLSQAYDKINDSLPPDLEGINPSMFWAAGKLLALRETPAPVVMLDTDFIVWELPRFADHIIAAHREELLPDIYPEFSHFKMKSGYTFRKEFDKYVLPCNTAFLYLPDESFKQYYVSAAIDFMRSSADTSDNLCPMVFAEQRVLPMCARICNAEIDTLLDYKRLYEPQTAFTHIWGAKRVLRTNETLKKNFIHDCRERLKREFPGFELNLYNN